MIITSFVDNYSIILLTNMTIYHENLNIPTAKSIHGTLYTVSGFLIKWKSVSRVNNCDEDYLVVFSI